MKSKDIAIYIIIFVVLASIVLFIVFKSVANNNLDFLTICLSIIGNIVLVLTGIIGLFEFANANGFTFIVPDSYIEYKEKQMLKQTQEFVNTYFEKNIEFVKSYSNENVKYILNTMGISEDGYSLVKYELTKAKMMYIWDIDTARIKLSEILYNSNKIIDLHKTTDSTPDAKVKYYFKFSDLMHDSSLCGVIVEIMALYIQHSFNYIELEKINVCMLPHSSNYLLGYNVSRILNKNFIKMIPEDKIIANFTYEGIVDTQRSMKVIVIHDILFTSKQVYQSIDTLKRTHPNCEVAGIFCLIYRNVHNGKQELENRGYKVYPLLELSEDEISEKLGI